MSWRKPQPAPAVTAPRLRWSLLGILIGSLVALVLFAPAAWLAQGLGKATGGRLLIVDARGTVWRGSGVLVLTGGADSRDASALPGRLGWRLSPSLSGGPGLRLDAEQACCLNGQLSLLLRPGLGRWAAELLPSPGWIGQWPSAWLGGLGTPWNTLQLGGQLRLLSRGLTAEMVQGRLRLAGGAELELQGMSSRLSTLPTLGSYRLQVSADPAGGTGGAQLILSTLEGALQLSGSGQWGSAGLRLRGEARAATPGDEAALGNLLNIIGRRQGARSVISIG
jgi:general secretion pathway protein N